MNNIIHFTYFRFLILLLIVAMYCNSIHPYTVNGRVNDIFTKLPLENVTVSICDSAWSILQSQNTDSLGSFSLQYYEKPIYIHAQSEGYNYLSLTIDSINYDQQIDLRLEPYSTTELEELTVTASTLIINANKETHIITNKLRENTINAIDLIDKLPGITVDPTTDKIKIGFSSDVKIIVNGEEMPESYARSINPNRISKIELIKNPTGKFSSYPIILNIITKERVSGIDLNANAIYFQQLVRGATDNGRINVNFSSIHDKWDFYAAGDYGRSHKPEAFGRYLKIYDSYQSEEPMPKMCNANKVSDLDNLVLNSGMSLRPNDKRRLSLQVQYDKTDNHSIEFSNRKTSDASWQSELRHKYYTNNIVASAYYSDDFTDRISFNATLTYNYYDINERQIEDIPGVVLNSELHGKKHYFATDITASYMINNRLLLIADYDMKTRNYHTLNNELARNKYIETRNSPTVLLQFSYDKLSGNIGATYLDIYANNNVTNKRQRSLTPRAYIYYAPRHDLSLSLNYIMSTEYPNLDLLSNQLWSVYDQIYSSGNPNLKAKTLNYIMPSIRILNIIDLIYMYQYSNNDISKHYELIKSQPNPYILENYVNTNYKNQYIGISYFSKFIDQIDVNIKGFYQWYTREYKNNQNNGRTWYLDIDTKWNILKSGYIAGCGFFMRDDKDPLSLGETTNYNESLWLSFEKLLLKKRMKISFSCSFPTHMLPQKESTRVRTSEFEYIRTINVANYSNWRIRLNLSYVINKGSKTKKMKDIIYEKEK